jgi:hypothetical protein
MSEDPTSQTQPTASPAARQRRKSRRIIKIVALVILVYLIGAYFIAPALWRFYFYRHPSLDSVPRITEAGDHHPGDPLNVALIGTETEVKKLMVAAKWYPADPLTLKSCLEIAEASVLRRPYEEAPVSSLYLGGRKQDLAFEQPVGNNPRERHHVRFWLTEMVDPDGRPVWVGAAIFDQRVGLNRTTGQITHFIAADIDAERNYLFRDLEQTSRLSETFVVDGFHKVLEGRNGGGHPWHTDGKLHAGVIAAESSR